MAVKGWISFWWLPIISALVWVGMLLGMLLHWIINDHSRPYAYQDQDISVVFISNVGADVLKPLFIAGSCVVCVFLDLSMLAARWLRHQGRLVPNSSRGERSLAIGTIVFGVMGTMGLILLSVFDTKNYNKLHYVFLLFFLGGYMLSAVCTCCEYQRLGIKHREHRDLRASFWAKLAVVLIEGTMAIAFVVTNFTKQNDVAAILEWAIAFLFTFFILSFVIDLYPAVTTKPHTARFEKRGPREMEEGSGATTPHHYSNGNVNSSFNDNVIDNVNGNSNVNDNVNSNVNDNVNSNVDGSVNDNVKGIINSNAKDNVNSNNNGNSNSIANANVNGNVNGKVNDNT
ncbi:FK506 suppressor Sfk1 [Cordyceps militaris CM01]|uniref:FK506 suppressor Sfk1 n=1 Tax=Cordyceps militaris (strain CM01) TaxID=983644 RepID=G3JD54_CORMM|nr:FK506 suppressor Sfk1 [Cordyceps militaris CM01]EGX92529.1 FK506 suppressor Sfk1 [Cordyceps militaris CM01]